MKLHIELENLSAIEFGVGRDYADGRTFVAVPVDSDVQAALAEMVQQTWDALQKDEEGPRDYEPSEKHASTEYLRLALGHDLAGFVRELHEAGTLDLDAEALTDPRDVFCYFARLKDGQGRRVTALRRATQFKGILSSRNRLVRWVDDTLRIIEDPVFKLDYDFDLLADDAYLHILRPSGFEFAGKLQQAILDAVPKNVQLISADLPFVDFGSIAEYAGTHTRAARYLTSIRDQLGSGSIDRALLGDLCELTDVEIAESNGRVCVAPGHELAFLEVLDRRRYLVNLVKDQPELYRAASRRKLRR